MEVPRPGRGRGTRGVHRLCQTRWGRLNRAGSNVVHLDVGALDVHDTFVGGVTQS
jgi:hypothetical protein